MSDIDQDVTQADIDQATEQNRAILQERFPDLDISVGGPVDSVLVDGNAVITAQNNANVDEALLVTQLQAIAEGTVTIDDEDMDRLMANYFLTRQEAIPATGNVVFVVRDNRNYILQTGYTMVNGDQNYILTETFSIYPIGTTGIDFSIDTNVLIEQVFDAETGFQYQFTLPITSEESAPEAVRVSGDRFEPNQPFDGLGYIEATTNFSGGTAEETNQEFATRGLQGLLAYTVGGNDHINKIVQDVVQLGNSNSLGAGDPMMTRDRNNVFNIPTGGKVDTYCKAGAVAQAGYLVSAEVVDFTTREIKITLTREESAGVYRVSLLPRFTSTPPTIVSGSIVVTDVNHLVWTDTSSVGAFNPEMPDEYDRAFSARQQIEILAVDDRMDGGGYVVSMTFNGEIITDSYSVETQYQPQILDADSVLTDSEVRPPGTDILVKAAVPCLTTLGVVASKPSDYNGPSAGELADTIASVINQLPVSTESLDASIIAGILRVEAPELTLTSLSMNGLVYGQNDINYAVGTIGGKLTPPENSLAKISPRNTYFATTSADVTVALV